MPITYKTHLFCSKCGIYVPKENIEKVSRPDKMGRLLHECGWRLREIARRHNAESVKEWQIRNRQVSLNRSVREDIELNRERWKRVLTRQ